MYLAFAYLTNNTCRSSSFPEDATDDDEDDDDDDEGEIASQLTGDLLACQWGSAYRIRDITSDWGWEKKAMEHR